MSAGEMSFERPGQAGDLVGPRVAFRVGEEGQVVAGEQRRSPVAGRKGEGGGVKDVEPVVAGASLGTVPMAGDGTRIDGRQNIA